MPAHACRPGRSLASGGRVLGVTAWGHDLPEALAEAYTAIRTGLTLTGMQYRKDIGARALPRTSHGTVISLCEVRRGYRCRQPRRRS